MHLDGFWASRGDEAAVPDVFPVPYPSLKGVPGDSVIKKPPANAGDAGDMGLIPGLGRPPGGGNGNPLQYSYLGIPMDRGAWWDSPWGHQKIRCD